MEKIVFKNWFQELNPAVQRQLQYGKNEPYKNIEYIWHLSPDEIREAVTDPQLNGLLVQANLNDPEEVESQVKNLIRYAGWLRDGYLCEAALDDYIHLNFVRYYGGKAVIMHWDDSQKLIIQSIEDFKKSYVDKYIFAINPKNGRPERIPFSDVFLKHPRIKRYEKPEFLPGVTEEDKPENVINLWRGWSLRSDITDDNDYEPEDCRLFLNHLRDNLCGQDDDVYIYLLGWMADALINPHRTCEVALVLHGPQGSGKTLFAKLFMQFFTPHTLVLDKPDQVTGTHNRHLQDKCIIFADEAFFAGNRQHGATLKTLVTSEEIFIHPKFVDGFMAKKLFRMIIASNDEHVIRAEVDDRRYLVLSVDAGKHNQDSYYFGAIVDEWNNGGKQALFNWLRGAYWRRTLETGAWEAGLRPKTKALNKQKDLSLPKTQSIVHLMLNDGELPNLFITDREKQLIFIATSLVAEKYKLEPHDQTSLGAAIRILAGPDAKSERAYIKDGNHNHQYRGYWVPALDVCRQRWETYLGRTIDWPEHITSWELKELDNQQVPPEDYF